MSKLRSVSTSFWSDPFIEESDPNEKLLFLYLITNEKTNMLGIYEASVKKISFETGLKEEVVLKSLANFEKLNKVKRMGNWIILVNYMKHQHYNTNMKKSAIDIHNSLPKTLKNDGITVSKDDVEKGFESLLNHYGMVSKIEVEYEFETELEIKDESEAEKQIEKNQEEEVESTNEKNKDLKDSVIDFDALIKFYNGIYNRKCTKIKDEVKKKYINLLKDHDKNAIANAMVNARRDLLQAKSKFKYCTIEYFSRDKTIEMFGFEPEEEVKVTVNQKFVAPWS